SDGSQDRVHADGALTVDGEDAVARLQAHRRRRTAGRNAADGRRRQVHPLGEEEQRQDRAAEDDIDERTGEDDGRPLSDRFWEKRALALRPIEQTDAAAGIAHEALLAEHLDIAAERQERELEAGAVPVGETDQLAPESDREGLDPHAAAARHDEMAELMYNGDDQHHPEERQRIGENGRYPRHRADSSPLLRLAEAQR